MADLLKEFAKYMEYAKEAQAKGDKDLARESEQMAFTAASGGKLPTQKIEKVDMVNNDYSVGRNAYRGIARSELGNRVMACSYEGSTVEQPGTRNITVCVDRPNSKISVVRKKASENPTTESLVLHDVKSFTYGEPNIDYTLDKDGQKESGKFNGRFLEGKAKTITGDTDKNVPSMIGIDLNSSGNKINIVSASGLELDLKQARQFDSNKRILRVSESTIITCGPETSNCELKVVGPKENGRGQYEVSGPTTIRVHQSMLSNRAILDDGGKPIRGGAGNLTPPVSLAEDNGLSSLTGERFGTMYIPANNGEYDNKITFPNTSHVILEVYNDAGKTINTIPISKDGKYSGSREEINAKIVALGSVLNNKSATINPDKQEPVSVQVPSMNQGVSGEISQNTR